MSRRGLLIPISILLLLLLVLVGVCFVRKQIAQDGRPAAGDKAGAREQTSPRPENPDAARIGSTNALIALPVAEELLPFPSEVIRANPEAVPEPEELRRPYPQAPLWGAYNPWVLPRFPHDRPEPSSRVDTGFARHIRGLQRPGIDVVIVVDPTASEGKAIAEFETRLREVLRAVCYLVAKARIGLVPFHDRQLGEGTVNPFRREDESADTVLREFVPLTAGLTGGLAQMRDLAVRIRKQPRGAFPPLAEALSTAVEKAGWRKDARKIIILLGDAPPAEAATVREIARKWKESGNALSCLDATGNSKIMDEFKELARDGGGEALSLANDPVTFREVVYAVFGSRWQTDLDRLCDALLPKPRAP